MLRARLHKPRQAVQLRLSPFTVPARGEREVCQAVELAGSEPMDVAEFQFAAPTSRSYVTHHFGLMVDDNDDLASLPKGPVSAVGCVGFGRNFGSVIALVQRSRGAVAFPPGVGFTFRPHQVLLLNLHFINASPRPLRIDGAVNLVRAPKGSIVHHARGFQLGTFRIAVPPGQDGSAEAGWIAPFPMNVVQLGTHSHKHTTSVDVDLLRAGSDAGQILQTLDYEHPTLTSYFTPLRLGPGDGFRWTCDYHNDTTGLLRFGVTSQDEMCFTIGTFYLDDDAAPMPHVPGCLGTNEALTCPNQ